MTHSGEAQRGVVVVWVPTGRLTRLVAQGSGVVSISPAGGVERVTIDVEGNLYGSAGMEVFANRVFHAYDRQAADYPTIARLFAPVAELQRVGTFDAAEGVVVLDDPEAVADNRAVLAAWLGTDSVREEDLIATGRQFSDRRLVRRLLASPDPADHEKARWYARHAKVDLPVGPSGPSVRP